MKSQMNWFIKKKNIYDFLAILNRFVFLKNVCYLEENILKNKFATSGNALARVQQVNKPADLWDITFCTRWFCGF